MSGEADTPVADAAGVSWEPPKKPARTGVASAARRSGCATTPEEELERAVADRSAMVMAVSLTLELGRAILRGKERDTTVQHKGPPFVGAAGASPPAVMSDPGADVVPEREP